MKYFFLSIGLFLAFHATAQEVELQSKIDFVNSNIQQSQKAERLRWMDSLVELIRFNEALNYDSILQQSIQFAVEIDSLEAATRKTNEYVLYKREHLGDPAAATSVFNAFLDKVELLPDGKTKANFFYHGAGAYYNVFDMENALTYYVRAKEYAQHGNPVILGDIHSMIGGIYLNMGKTVEASQELQIGLDLLRQRKDTIGIIDVKNKMSIVYSQHAFYEEAEKERNEAIQLIHEHSGNSDLLLFYFNAAADYRMMDKQSKRIEYIKLAIAHNNGPKHAYYMPFLLYELIIALAENDSLAQAETYFRQVKNEVDQYDSDQYRDLYIETLKQLELAKGNYTQALQYGKKHLALKRQQVIYVEIMNAEKFLADVYKKIDDAENSNKHLLNYYELKDSITGVQNAKNLFLYQTLYETEKRDLEIENQKASIDFLYLENKNKTQLLIFGSVGLLLLFAAMMVYRSFVHAKNREKAQQAFSQELISTQEQERTRIAKDLHDGLGQQITLIKMKAQNAEQAELSALAHTALEEVRGISRDLYPVTLTKLGLTNSIEQLLLDLDEETDLFVSIEIDDVNANFNEAEALNFYRFIQESINNVLKHAQAKTLIVNINKQREGIKILIKDNGIGFEVSNRIKQNSLGLKTMAERISMLKGKLSIKSKREEGTSILVQIPVS